MGGLWEEAHRLVDALDEGQVGPAVEVLRVLAGGTQPCGFGWIGMLSAESDLGGRSGEILRRELGNAG